METAIIKRTNHMNKLDKKTLKIMLDELKKSPKVYHPSKFWTNLNKFHNELLNNSGFENFKRTINYHYFSWGVLSIIMHQLNPIFEEIFRGNFSPIFSSHFVNPAVSTTKGMRTFNPLAAFIYRVYVASLIEYVSRTDKLSLLKKLEEPQIGNPFIVKYKGKNFSQDLCNSIHEFYSINNNIQLPKNPRIVELGAGYGRLSYIFLNAIPGSSYCIVDIPPALLISQNYLKAIFPKEKVFLFRPFNTFEEVKREFESSRIKFIMPHQLELLPDKYFDLFINISSLHEMTTEQIKIYLKLINKLSKGYFYTKQWRKAQTMDNLNIKEREYPIPNNWKVLKRSSPHPIQRMFFDTLYRID